MPRRTKFRPGKVLTLWLALEHVLAGRYIYHRHKPLHPGWIRSWPVQLLINAAFAGVLREAIYNRKPGETDAESQEDSD
jgi:hypothetical protein